VTFPARHSILILPLALVLLGWSGLTLAVDLLVAAPYREIAEHLETGRVNVPEREHLERLERNLGVAHVWQLCSRDIVRSAVTVKLTALDEAFGRRAPPASIESALVGAEATLRNALHCLPTDGNLWLRLAIVRFARARAVGESEKQLAMSLAAAPSEAWIMRARFAFAAGLGEPTSAVLASVLQTDAGNLVARARAPDVASLYLAAGASARTILDEQIARVSKTRQEELSAALEEAAARAEEAHESPPPPH
jgi:hypothetical protein